MDNMQKAAEKAAPHQPAVAVSVIVPVYNTEKYLRECLDSIASQTLEDIEVICVDDGSTDGSPDILREYAERDSRFHVFHQENQFAGIARNNGMAHAVGEYVIFLDSDDFFEPGMLEEIYALAKRESADICAFSGWRYDEQLKSNTEGKSYVSPDVAPKSGAFSIDDAPEHIFQVASLHVCNKLYRLGFLREAGIEFTSHRNGEDGLFVIKTLCRAGSIVLLPKPFFHYRVNTLTSTSDTVSATIMQGYETLVLARDYLVEQGLYTPEVKRSFANRVLRRCLFFIASARTREAYALFYDKLVLDGGFAELGVVEREPEYYYRAGDYARFCKMMELRDADAYLFEMYLAKCDAVRKKAKRQQKLARERDSALDKLAGVRESSSYRVGRAITLIPRKVGRLFGRRR